MFKTTYLSISDLYDDVVMFKIDDSTIVRTQAFE